MLKLFFTQTVFDDCWLVQTFNNKTKIVFMPEDFSVLIGTHFNYNKTKYQPHQILGDLSKSNHELLASRDLNPFIKERNIYTQILREHSGLSFDRIKRIRKLIILD